MITTFDIRMTSPNEEPVMNTAELHAMEHSGSYFSPKSYRIWTKSHLLGSNGAAAPEIIFCWQEITNQKDIVGLITEMFEFIRDFEGEIPGASAKDCGNYLDMNLNMAKYLADKYLKEVLYDIKEERLVYPE